jgi:hypothetical protein
VLSEVDEKAVEDAQTQSKDSLFIADTVLKKSITKSISDNIYEFLPIEKSGTRLLNHSHDQLKS